jgi:hypothetical protein
MPAGSDGEEVTARTLLVGDGILRRWMTRRNMKMVRRAIARQGTEE